MAQNLIHLNGVTYDTRTGKVVSTDPHRVSAAQPLQKKSSPQAVVDGFMRPQKTRQKPTATQPIQKKPTVQKSQTLARQAVKKPEKNAVIEHAAEKSLRPLQAKKFFDFGRNERASKVQKNQSIFRFAPSSNATLSPAATREQSTAVKAAEVEAPSRSVTNSPRTPEPTPLEKAVQNATSHTNTLDEGSAPKSKRGLFARFGSMSPKIRYTLAGIIAVMGIGFIGYSSAPLISYEIATARSGMKTERPAYTPSGFNMDHNVAYEDGSITLNYQSNSDDRRYTVHKERTNWNTETLRSDFVEGQGLYQSIPSRGKTIYLYDQSRATWIDGGVWYTIEGTAGLSSDQILRIANSL